MTSITRNGITRSHPPAHEVFPADLYVSVIQAHQRSVPAEDLGSPRPDLRKWLLCALLSTSLYE
jgi:hypothetical protein